MKTQGPDDDCVLAEGHIVVVIQAREQNSAMGLRSCGRPVTLQTLAWEADQLTFILQ